MVYNIPMRVYKKSRTLLWSSLILLCIVTLGSMMIGRFSISPKEIFRMVSDTLGGLGKDLPAAYLVFFYNRMPRVIAALFIGAGLSSAGAVYQALFKNPMVSPDILGASAAAGFGAALSILLGKATGTITMVAFLTSLVGVAMAYGLSTRFKTSPILGLILSGILVGSLFSSGISYLKIVADSENALPQITYWLMGSLASIRLEDLLFVLPVLGIPLIILFLLRWRINLFTLSDDEAKSSGVHVKRMRSLSILLATLITAGSVAVAGIIGWVGLVVPHMARAMVGDDNRFVVPLSMTVGGIFLILCDTLARTLSSLEIPLGIITSLIGVPFFIFLLLIRGKYGYKH